MRRSIFSCFLFALSACIAAFVHTFEPVAHAVYSAGKFVAKVVFGVVCDACKLAKPESESRRPGVLGVIEAKSFVSRIEKRERPVVTDSWRMCASI